MINFNELKEIEKNIYTIINESNNETAFKKLFGLSVSKIMNNSDIKENYSKREIEEKLRKVINCCTSDEEQIAKESIRKSLLAMDESFDNEIGDWQFIVPIDNLWIEKELKIGSITLSRFKEDILPIVTEYYIALLKKTYRPSENAKNEIDVMLKSLMGLVCAQITVRGRIERAQELALDSIAKALNIIKLFGSAGDDRSGRYFGVCGEVTSRNRTILRYKPNGLSFCTSYERIGIVVPFFVDTSRLAVMKECRFDIIEAIFSKNTHNDFETRLLTAIYWYGKAYDVQLSKFTMADNQKNKNFDKMKEADRLLKLIITLESLLIFNEEESLRRNVAERTAVILSRNKEEYERVKEFMLRIYQLRSRVVHHGEIAFSLPEMYELQFVTRNVILALMVEKDNWGINDLKDFRYWLEKNRIEYEFGKT